MDTAEITPALIEAQEQASHAISRKLDHLFSGGGTAQSKKIKSSTRKRKKPTKPKPKPKKAAPKKKKVQKRKKKPAPKNKKKIGKR